MNFFKKYNGKTKIGLIFIGVVLTTCGIAFAIPKFFSTETKNKVNVQNKFAGLVVTDANVTQDPSVNKFLIPTDYPMLSPSTDTHKVIKTFVGKLDNNGKAIEKDMFLKTTLKYENNDEIGKFFISQLKIDSKIYSDTNREKIVANKDYKITVETQQTAFADENLTEITVIVEYELVDSKGESFAGTKDIIQTQTTNNKD
jgi:hypothetical protein